MRTEQLSINFYASKEGLRYEEILHPSAKLEDPLSGFWGEVASSSLIEEEISSGIGNLLAIGCELKDFSVELDEDFNAIVIHGLISHPSLGEMGTKYASYTLDGHVASVTLMMQTFHHHVLRALAAAEKSTDTPTQQVVSSSSSPQGVIETGETKH